MEQDLKNHIPPSPSFRMERIEMKNLVGWDEMNRAGIRTGNDEVTMLSRLLLMTFLSVIGSQYEHIAMINQ